jgi:hypothetical protein
MEHAWFGTSSQGCGGLSLRVKIDQQHPPAFLGQAMRQGDGGGGFADPALLIGNTDYFCRHKNGSLN